MKKIIIAVAALAFSGKLMAQQYTSQPFETVIARDFTYGQYSLADVEMANYAKDPSAHALVLREFGCTRITSNGNKTSLTFDYHVRIKIFDDKGLVKGTVSIPVYSRDNGTYEDVRLTSINALAINQDADRTVHVQELSPDDITVVKKDRHWSYITFKLPKIHAGSIIEYKYKLDSPILDELRPWYFQSDIPKVYTEYEVHIPNVFGYNISTRGGLKFSRDSATIEKECFESTNLKSNCAVEAYQMKDVPAFKQEPFMPSPANYISSIHFQLTQDTQLNNFAILDKATQQNVGSTWDIVDNGLKFNDNFGSQLNRKSIFKDKFKTLLAGKTDTLDIARAIYAYIQSEIVFNNIYGIYTDDGIKHALDKHTGNAAEINLALATALNAAGLNASPVLVSTRDNGVVNQLYPALSEFNYVVVATIIHNRPYMLDATEPALGFGVLPLRAMNGDGRLVSIKEPSYWVPVKTGQQKADSYIVAATLDGSGKLTGTIRHISASYEAFDRRKAIKSYKNADDYLKSVRDSLPGITITKADVMNADSLNSPLTEVYQFELAGKTTNGSVVFDAVIADKLTRNPFVGEKRTYPVDFGMAQTNNYVFTISLPDNYEADGGPEAISETLPNKGGALEANYANGGGTVTYSRQYQFSRLAYSIAEYPFLAAFTDKILSTEKVPLAFKKK